MPCIDASRGGAANQSRGQWQAGNEEFLSRWYPRGRIPPAPFATGSNVARSSRYSFNDRFYRVIAEQCQYSVELTIGIQEVNERQALNTFFINICPFLKRI